MKELIEQIVERIEKELSPQMIISKPLYHDPRNEWDVRIEFRKDWIYLGHIQINLWASYKSCLLFHISQITYNQGIPMNRVYSFLAHTYKPFDLQNGMQDILSVVEDFKQTKIERTEKKET